MKSLTVIIFTCIIVLVGCEQKLPLECSEPLKMYDELINRSDISIEQKKQLMDSRNQLVSDAKNARTEHLAIVVCGDSYNKISEYKRQLNVK